MVQEGSREMRRRHVFAVNSDSDLLHVLRLILESEGYAATVARIAPDPFARIAALAPDALVVDLAPGEQGGWALLERLRADTRTRAIPAVVTSTTPALLARVEADPARYGATATVLAPFGIDALVGAVARACAL